MDEVLNVKINKFKYNNQEDNTLENIKLSIKKGQLIVLTGLSGCGKSTLMRIMNGLVPYHYEGELDGRVELLGKDIMEYKQGELAKHIGNVFQNPSDQFFATICDEEVAFVGENLGMEHKLLHEKVDNAFKLLDIEELKSKKVFELSGGEKQKVAIASTLIYDTDIIFFDEPSASLDYKGIEEFKNLLIYLQKMGKTIVISEHRLFFLKDIYDKIVYIKDREIDKVFDKGELTSKDCENYCLRNISYDKLESENHTLTKNVLERVNDIDVSIKDKKLLNGISIELCESEIMGILGNNGTGKSTLGRILGGLQGGKKDISFGNKEKDRLKNSYYMMQDVDYLLFFDTVENELVPKYMENDKFYLSSIKSTITKLDLWDKRLDHPQNLSGGEKQRLALINAFISEKKIIILDEPTSGLDYGRMEKVKEIINLYAKKRPVIIITHDIELLFKICNTALLIADDKSYEKIELYNNESKIFDFLNSTLK